MKSRIALLDIALILILVVTACGAPQATTAPTAATTSPPPTSAPTAAPTAAPTVVPTAAPTVQPTVAPTAAPAEVPLYLSIIWHQHQPLYFQDPQTGVYLKPWVRLHAAKDYVDMAAMLENYPDVQVTFNLTPSLLRQLQDLEGGTQDLYEVYTLIPADKLTDEDKTFIVNRFFDINAKIIARFPRYQEIADDRQNSANWDAQTWRDLQVLFNLGWTDPDWLAQEPLAGLVSKGRDYAEEDKTTILDEHARLVAKVIPLHKQLQDEGRIEITTTPFYHPILPLILDTNEAKIAVPDITLPNRFTYGFDAKAQIKLGVDYYTQLFGRAPAGMWPAEGAVAQDIVGMVAQGGLQWMASDEEVLARSLGKTSFSRDSQEVVQEPDALYRPYIVGNQYNQMYIIFRDKVISDKVGFTYSGTPGVAAAQDFVNRILAIRDQLAQSGATGPHLVSVILDGENAWENYPNDGKEFLNNMYQLLQEEQQKGTIQTITPAEFIGQFTDQPRIQTLWAGSWVSPDFLTWIGEPEENRAWDYLGTVRAYVERKKMALDADTLAKVMDQIYAAEGSDWFWWFGDDQNSGDDASFDLQFRLTLQRVYELLDQPVPTFLKVPIIAQTPQAPEAGASKTISPTVDGVAAEGEWDGAGYYVEQGGVQATPSQIASQLWYGFDKDNLYLRLDARRAWADVGTETRIGFYLTKPGGGPEQPFSRIGADQTLLGFGANALAEVTVKGQEATATFYLVGDDGTYQATEAKLPVGVVGSTLELAVPYVELGRPDAGDTLKLRAVISEDEQRDIQVVPGGGPAAMTVPDLGLTQPILTVADPEKDDHGPGSYTYPLDTVFKAGAFDLTEFAVAEDGSNLIFRFTFAGPLDNSWGAPNGMGIHTLDVYIDAADGGERKLLPGRNAALPEGSGWEFAVWAEGWTPGLYGPPAAGDTQPAKIGDPSTLNIASDPGQHKITIRIAKQVFADQLGVAVDALDPASWGYLGVVLSQEGYPSSGVWRVRDVVAEAQQWRLGGAPNDTNHTRIIDVAYPAGFTPTQEEALSTYPPSQEGNMDNLGPDDFAPLPLVQPQ
jgi:alpha-amylase/alpha-mannosidase (GH57 family)